MSTDPDPDPAFNAPVVIAARGRLRCLLDGCPATAGNPDDCRLHQHRLWPADDRGQWLAALPPWAVGSMLLHHQHCPRNPGISPSEARP